MRQSAVRERESQRASRSTARGPRADDLALEQELLHLLGRKSDGRADSGGALWASAPAVRPYSIATSARLVIRFANSMTVSLGAERKNSHRGR